jgi:hypothetical protein
MCLAAAMFGQGKKTVAVYTTGSCSENIKKVMSCRIIAQIVRSKEYAAVGRTLEFDRVLRREQSYQVSGNVDGGQAIKLGKQFGAGLVCLADASEKNKNYFFTAYLINIETGLVISFSLDEDECSYHRGCNNSNSRSMSRDCGLCESCKRHKNETDLIDVRK